jgi:hypothetical protein
MLNEYSIAPHRIMTKFNDLAVGSGKNGVAQISIPPTFSIPVFTGVPVAP